MSKNYVKPAANASAVTKLNSWLHASGIEAEPAAGDGADVIVKRGDKVLRVRVAMDGAGAANDAMEVLAGDLTSTKDDIALAAFHRITEAIGAGKPDPTNLRGPAPKRKLHYSDNFELVSFRHRDFRRVPNPTAAELAEYEPIMRRSCKSFMLKNKMICARSGHEIDDLMTFARVWTCNYLGLFKVENPTVNDNERKLSAYLFQRFAEFATMLIKKERNCIPDSETASIAMFGKPNRASNSERKGAIGYSFSDDEMDFEDYTEDLLAEDVIDEEIHEMVIETEPIDMHIEISAAEEKNRKASDAKRRKWASDVLTRLLADLPHDKMVAKLAEVIDNKHVVYDARMEARRRLRLHRQGCTLCSEVQK